jgi:hypothetical protein
MPVAFRTKDAAYKGPTVFPLGALLRDVLIATEHLPLHFPTERFHPFRHGGRYVIAVDLLVLQHAVVLHAALSGAHPGLGESEYTLYKALFERAGLPIILHSTEKDYPGILVPFSPPERARR